MNCVLALLLLLIPLVPCDVLVYTYPNAAFAGPPTVSTIANISAAALTIPAQTIASIDLRTMLVLPPTGGSVSQYVLNCTFTGNLAGFVWLDNHLLCTAGYDVSFWW